MPGHSNRGEGGGGKGVSFTLTSNSMGSTMLNSFHYLLMSYFIPWYVGVCIEVDKGGKSIPCLPWKGQSKFWGRITEQHLDFCDISGSITNIWGKLGNVFCHKEINRKFLALRSTHCGMWLLQIKFSSELFVSLKIFICQSIPRPWWVQKKSSIRYTTGSWMLKIDWFHRF